MWRKKAGGKQKKDELGKVKWLFSKIDNRDSALNVIKQAAISFYTLAVLFLLAGFFFSSLAIVDAVILGVLGVLLHTLKSRVVAILLLIYSIAVLGVTVLNLIVPGSLGGGTNILLSIIVVWVSIRAVQATFKLGKLK
jgi:hypothetical protein